MIRTLAILVIALPLSAQQFENYSGMRIRFDAPGARSTAMGGTADALTDVFAGATNPAALAHQRTRSAAIELRRSESSTDFITGGVLLERPDLTPVTSKNSALSSAIVVLPARNVTWAIYYDEPLAGSVSTSSLPAGQSLAIGIDRAGGRIVSPSECAENCDVQYLRAPLTLFAVDNVQLTSRRLGAAGAWSRGPLSIGGAVRYEQLREHIRSVAVEETTVNGHRLAWSAGAQWQIAPMLRAGGSYRSGAAFPATTGVNYFFRTPSSYSAGLAADVLRNLTIAADAVRVQYSEMKSGTPLLQAGSDIPDVTELHAGAEYRLSTRLPIAVRAGWWRDPAHRLRSTLGPINGDLQNLGLLDADENHVTAGIGIGDRVRLDAAYDRSEHTSRASLTLASNF